jgi:tetratricopeptide (TPR) repeat protein
VARTLAEPYGIIFQADSPNVAHVPPEDWEAYSCTLAYYTYRVGTNPQTYTAVRQCLERTVGEFPGFATGWALLSLIYLDKFRFHYDEGIGPEPLPAALEYAQRAIELDPQNVRGLQAYMMALYLNDQVPAALEVGKRALSINPNDNELRAEYGVRLAQSGAWQEGTDLIEEALVRSPGRKGYFEATLALCYYMLRDNAKAVALTRKSDLQANPVFHFIAAAVYARAGDRSAVAVERAWLETYATSLLKNIRHDLAARLERPEDQAYFIEGLELAGLTVPGHGPGQSP